MLIQARAFPLLYADSIVLYAFEIETCDIFKGMWKKSAQMRTETVDLKRLVFLRRAAQSAPIIFLYCGDLKTTLYFG
jgi:hypothetical protein